MISANLQGRWTITGLLSDSGGNAQLWKARDVNGAVAAIKIPRHIADSVRNQKRLKRFESEIQAMLSVQQAGIESVMPIIDQGLGEDGKPWYAMPIGKPLFLGSAFMSRLALVAALSAVIAKLHKHGIEHLDIKVDNLLMVDGAMVLSDFGHSKFTDPVQLGCGDESSDTDADAVRSRVPDTGRRWFDYDMYSLGKACWEILTGIKSKSLCELRSPNDDLQPYWRDVDPQCIQSLQALIFSAASRIPEKRPNAMQYNEGIQEILRLAKP